MVGTALLHWLISQSLFVIIIQSYQPDGEALPNGRMYTNGFSIIPIIVCKFRPIDLRASYQFA
jgi:hypothetical protein